MLQIELLAMMTISVKSMLSGAVSVLSGASSGLSGAASRTPSGVSPSSFFLVGFDYVHSRGTVEDPEDRGGNRCRRVEREE